MINDDNYFNTTPSVSYHTLMTKSKITRYNAALYLNGKVLCANDIIRFSTVAKIKFD